MCDDVHDDVHDIVCDVVSHVVCDVECDVVCVGVGDCMCGGVYDGEGCGKVE